MKKDEFYYKVAENLKTYLPEEYQNAKISVERIEKPEGPKTGITVAKELGSIIPVVYLDDKFAEFSQEKKKLEDIFHEAAQRVVDAEQMIQGQDLNLDRMQAYESSASQILPELLSKNQRTEFLKEYAYTYEIPDCIATYSIQLNDSLKVRVTNKMLDTWGISKEELRKTAIQNIKEVEFQSMTSLLAEAGLPLEISEVELQQDPGLYVLTNPRRSYGAAVIMDSEVLKMVGEKLQSDYFVLPSSVHEVICVKNNGAISLEELQQMVREVNRTEVDPSERLSDQVCYYSCNQKQLIYARSGRELQEALRESGPKENKTIKKNRWLS